MGSSRNRILWLYINPLFLLINFTKRNSGARSARSVAP